MLLLNILVALLLLTTMMYILLKGQSIDTRLMRLQFLPGGFLLFIKQSFRPSKGVSAPSSKRTVLELSIVLLGIAVFYVVLFPKILVFLLQFFTLRARGPPPLIPVPLLLGEKYILPYLLVGIGVSVVIHEFLHAYAALRRGVPIKSWGIGIVLLVPLAFVEIDEDTFKNVDYRARIEILSAGVIGNAILALIALAIVLGASFYLQNSGIVTGVEVIKVDCSICDIGKEHCVAETLQLRSGDIILRINDIRVNDTSSLSKILNRLRPYTMAEFEICRIGSECRSKLVNLSSIRTVNNKTIPCIGVLVQNTYFIYSQGVCLRPWYLPLVMETLRYVNMVFVISLSLFVLNALPLLVTDGSKILYTLVERYGIPKLGSVIRIIEYTNIALIAVACIAAAIVFLSG